MYEFPREAIQAEVSYRHAKLREEFRRAGGRQDGPEVTPEPVEESHPTNATHIWSRRWVTRRA